MGSNGERQPALEGSVCAKGGRAAEAALAWACATWWGDWWDGWDNRVLEVGRGSNKGTRGCGGEAGGGWRRVVNA